jgi:hypothetical protein
MIVSKDTATPSHATIYNALVAKPVYCIPAVAIAKIMKRERLMAPTVNGDLILENALDTRRREVDSATSTTTDINIKPRDAATPGRKILPPKIR